MFEFISSYENAICMSDFPYCENVDFPLGHPSFELN